jgi:hypothetical protein
MKFSERVMPVMRTFTSPTFVPLPCVKTNAPVDVVVVKVAVAVSQVVEEKVVVV